MAEVDLDDWEVLSCNSSRKDEFEEDDFTYFDDFSEDLVRKGEISDAEKSVKFDYGEVIDPVVGDNSGDNLLKLSSDFNSDMLVSSDKKGLDVVTYPDRDNDCSDLARGFEEKVASFVRDSPTEELVSSVTCDEHDSIVELGFGEMEVLNEFYLNQINDETCLTKDYNLEGESEQIYLENLNSSVFPFQEIENSDSVFTNESKGEILDWKSPKAILAEARKKNGGFFEMEMGLQIKVSNGDCSKELNGTTSGTNSSNDGSLKLAKDPDEQNISFDENKLKSTEAETGSKEKDLAKKQISKIQDGGKGEVLLSWWKAPIEVIKYCIFGVRPVWSISVAMGFLGFLMFSRSYYLYKMKQKDSKTRLPMKVRFDEKKRAVIQTRAARLNKVVSLVRPDPILRTPHPAFGVTLFPAMSSFQWAP